MSITMRPEAVRQGWLHAENAAAELNTASSETAAAAGTEMGDLASTLSDAASDMAGVMKVVLGVIEEHHTNLEACIRDFIATDGNSAGEFHGLDR